MFLLKCVTCHNIPVNVSTISQFDLKLESHLPLLSLIHDIHVIASPA